MISAVVGIGISAIAGVLTVVNIPSTGVFTSSGVLLLSACSDVPVLCCAFGQSCCCLCLWNPHKV